MKETFSCSLNGRLWWKPFLGLIVLSILLAGPMQKASNSLQTEQSFQVILSTILFILVLSIASAILHAAFYVLLSRIAIPSIKIKDKPFVFTASVGEFVSLTLVCSLLLIATLGFYLPWYYTRINRYIFSHIEYDGKPMSFLGKPKKLLKPYILGLLLPIFIWAFIFVFVFVLALLYTEKNMMSIATIFYILSTVIYLSILFLFIPFFYYFYKWTTNIAWKDMRITWKAEFWRTFFFIAGRVFLLLITLGIYIPAFMLSAWQYFVERVIVEKEEKTVARFGFIHEKGEGFRYLWSQILLSLITLGVYLPWAYANCLRYFLERTFYQDEQLSLPDTK